MLKRFKEINEEFSEVEKKWTAVIQEIKKVDNLDLLTDAIHAVAALSELRSKVSGLDASLRYALGE